MVRHMELNEVRHMKKKLKGLEDMYILLTEEQSRLVDVSPAFSGMVWLDVSEGRRR